MSYLLCSIFNEAIHSAYFRILAVSILKQYFPGRQHLVDHHLLYSPLVDSSRFYISFPKLSDTFLALA